MAISKKAKNIALLSLVLSALTAVVYTFVHFTLSGHEDRSVAESYKYLNQPTKRMRLLPEGELSADFIYTKGNWVGQGPIKDSNIEHLVNTAGDVRKVRIVFGEITEKGLSMLKKRNVQELRLLRTPLDEDCLKAISEVDSLRVLELQECLEGGILSALTGPQKLQTLNLRRTGVKNQDIRSIAQNLTSLEFLDLTHCKKVDDRAFKFLSAMPNLHDLYLSGTSMTPAAIADFVNHNQITGLDASNCGLTDSFVEQIESSAIRRLEVNGNPLTDKCFVSLAKIRKLHSVNMSGCSGITEKGIAAFKKLRPKCKLES